MPTDSILSLLIFERDRLNRAIAALQSPVRRGSHPRLCRFRRTATRFRLSLSPEPKRHIILFSFRYSSSWHIVAAKHECCVRLINLWTQRAAPQQRLYFLPLPQGQGSFRPRFGVDTCTFWRLNARRNRHRSKVWRSISKELKSGRTVLSASRSSWPEVRQAFSPGSGGSVSLRPLS